jgi:polyphosphate kinase 2 (PPK2 family)
MSKEEQLRRFQEREHTDYKRWKLTADDWRNRDKWSLYEAAVEDMVLRTSTTAAPWTVVEANYKWFARVKCLKTAVGAVSKALDYKPRDYAG